MSVEQAARDALAAYDQVKASDELLEVILRFEEHEVVIFMRKMEALRETLAEPDPRTVSGEIVHRLATGQPLEVIECVGCGEPASTYSITGVCLSCQEKTPTETT